MEERAGGGVRSGRCRCRKKEGWFEMAVRNKLDWTESDSRKEKGKDLVDLELQRQG